MKHVVRTPYGTPIQPLSVGWIWLVRRVIFRRRLPDWFTEGLFNHGPRELRRAYIWVGCAQNPNNLLAQHYQAKD